MQTKRVSEIDIIRGIVMVIMVIDHLRDMMHATAVTQSPTDLTTTTPALFFTRWITHLCAPVFVFLSGTSAYLVYRKTEDVSNTRKYLLKRGLLLILLELTIVNFGVWFDFRFTVFAFGIIASIGLCMIILSLFIKLSAKFIGLIGGLLILIHGIIVHFQLIPSSHFKVFFTTTVIPFDGGRIFLAPYPILAWAGIILIGFSFGNFFLLETKRKQKTFLYWGTGLILTALALRIVNGFGESAPWSSQKTELFTLLSFLNFSKYPPSIIFFAFFTGLMFLLLFVVNKYWHRSLSFFQTFGKEPLFFFLIHWYVIHAILFTTLFLSGFKITDFEFGFNFGRPKNWSGLGLLALYGVWLIIIVILYFTCRWYSSYKERNKDKAWVKLI